jgi:hypothetical protein
MDMLLAISVFPGRVYDDVFLSNPVDQPGGPNCRDGGCRFDDAGWPARLLDALGSGRTA